MSDPSFERLDSYRRLQAQYRAAPKADKRQRAALATAMRELRPDLWRADAHWHCDASADCDCDCDSGECTRLDTGTMSFRFMRGLLSDERVAELREQDPTDRLLLVEGLTAAARAAGIDDEQLLERIRTLSLDELADASRRLSASSADNPEPSTETERTDMSRRQTQPDPDAAQAAMKRRNQLAWLQPLRGDRPVDQAEPITAEEQARLDAAEKRYDAEAKFRAEQRELASKSYRARLDAGGLADPNDETKPLERIEPKPGTTMEELEQLAQFAKRQGIDLKEAVRLYEDLAELRQKRQPDDPAERTDARDRIADPVIGHRSPESIRLHRRIANAWREPLR